MRNIWTIASREFKFFFGSPIAYLVAFGILLVLGIFFYLNIQIATQQQFAPTVQVTIGPLATLLMLAVPAVTTRSLAEERRLGTIELLLTAPVRDWELVIGKWLGSFLFLATIIAVSLIFPFVLNEMVEPGVDQGPLITGYLGLFLLAGALVAIGVAISAFFNNQIAAFASIMATMIVLWWVIGPIAQVAGPAESSSALIGYLDLSQHFFSNLITGVLDLADIVYFLSVTSLALFVGTMAVETRRWR